MFLRGGGGGLGIIKDKEMLQALRSVAIFDMKRLTAGQAVFMLSVQLLESLRAGGCSLEIRPILHYLSHPALDSSPYMRDEMAAIANHVFSVFIEAACAGLSEAENPYLPQTRAKTSQMFQYYLTHCVHAHYLIRATSLRFIGRMLDRLPWLLVDNSSVSQVLNILNQLSIHKAVISSFKTNSDSSQKIKSTPNTPHKNPIPQGFTPNNSDLLVYDLLPNNLNDISEAALPLLEMVYSWLFSGMRFMASDLSAVLQEYILTEQLLLSASTSSHLGIAIAKEAAGNRSPVFHIAASNGEDSLKTERSLASYKISAQLPQTVSSNTVKNIAIAFTVELALKSRSLGEDICMKILRISIYICAYIYIYYIHIHLNQSMCIHTYK